MPQYFVGPGGSDANAGTSYALRKATLSAGLALLSIAGDSLVVCADAASPLLVSATTTIPSSGGNALPYRVIGGNPASGVVDGTQAVIDGQSSATYIVHDNNVARTNWVWQNITFKSATSLGFYLQNAGSDGQTFIACQFNSNGGGGFFSASEALLIDCRATSNTGAGTGGMATGGSMRGCSAVGNTGFGLQLIGSGRQQSITGSTSHANTTHGVFLVNLSTPGQPMIVAGNTIDGNTSNGIYVNQSGASWQVLVERNCITNNGAYAINGGASGTRIIARRNVWQSNTSGIWGPNVSQMEDVTDDNVSGDPKYEDRANDNFTPLLDSAAILSDRTYAGAIAPYRVATGQQARAMRRCA